MGVTRIPVSDFWTDPLLNESSYKINEFSFGFTEQSGQKRAYRVQPLKRGDYNSSLALHQLIWKVMEAEKGSYLPFNDPEYREIKSLLKITPINQLQTEMDLLASLDRIADRLEKRGCIKEAYDLDVIANTLDRWMSSQSTQFFDEVSNQGIEPDTAVKVLDIAVEHGLES